MAKHREENRLASSTKQTTQKRSPSVLLLSITAAAVSTVLVFGQATNNTVDSPQVQLAASTIGIGGRGDPTAARIPNKLHGKVVSNGFEYIPVNYPASFFIDSSVAAGVPVLDSAIRDNSVQSCDGSTEPCPFLLVVGYSEGTIVAEKVRRDLVPGVDGAPPADELRFVMIASPNIPNGGIFARFPGVSIPFFVTSNGPAQPSDYPTTYVTNEYDPYADFPAYFNPLSLLNTLLAIAYVHPDQYYDSVDYDPLADPTEEHNPNVIVTPVGNNTYVFARAAHLPLLAPARQIFGALGLTPLTEPVLSAIEPVLRLLVDMGYTDRENLNPEDHVPFSLITPPARIIETIAKIPGALGQGVNNFATGVGSIPAPVAPTIAPPNSPSINARSVPQEPQEDSLVNDDPAPTGVTDPAPPQAPSDPSTTPAKAPVSPLSKSEPTLGEDAEDAEDAEDGNKATPNTGKTTSPRKENVLKRFAERFPGGKKAPASTTPSSEPNDPTPRGSTAEEQQDQSEAHTSNAA